MAPPIRPSRPGFRLAGSNNLAVTRFYRFKVDLRKVDGLGGQAGTRRDELDLDDEGEELAAALAIIAELEPAIVDPSTWTDPLEAEELLEVYNASLRRGQSMGLGRYIQSNIEYHVVLDSWGNKRIISRPNQRPGSRVSELLVAANGGILRFSYEHEGGPQDVTDDLMEGGLEQMEESPARLMRSPGYVLRTTRFDRRGPYLVSFQQKMQAWDPTTNKIVTTGLS